MDEETTMRTTQICEADYVLIEAGLEILKRRFLANARRTKSGYGTARSWEKGEEWKAKAEYCQNLITRFQESLI